MSNNWYPIVDEVDCIKCGVCIDQCHNQVFNLENAPKPVVATPENCLAGCSGCGVSCPTGAITFLAEDSKRPGQSKYCTGCNQPCHGGC